MQFEDPEDQAKWDALPPEEQARRVAKLHDTPAFRALKADAEREQAEARAKAALQEAANGLEARQSALAIMEDKIQVAGVQREYKINKAKDFFVSESARFEAEYQTVIRSLDLNEARTKVAEAESVRTEAEQKLTEIIAAKQAARLAEQSGPFD